MDSFQDVKTSVKSFCHQNGIDIVGFASVKSWHDYDEVPEDFRPQSIWPQTRTVIVMGIAMPLPIVETTPSILHKEMYDTCNRELDSAAFNLVRYLNTQGYGSYFFPRDGYGSLKVLKEKPFAAFSHVMAGKYAGLGTIGLSHNLLSKEYGPRFRLVSVFTTAVIEPDAVLEKELCVKCKLCAQCCPKNALIPCEDSLLAEYDKLACTEMAEELVKKRAYPCGICIKVCPIGADRKLYQEKGIMDKYRKEAEALAANPEDPRYKNWTHIRKYGSY